MTNFLLKVIECMSILNATFSLTSNLIVNCEWANWDIGECSSTCGGGKRINTRDKKVKASHGGIDCPGSPTMNDICNVQECPGKILAACTESKFGNQI